MRRELVYDEPDSESERERERQGRRERVGTTIRPANSDIGRSGVEMNHCKVTHLEEDDRHHGSRIDYDVVERGD